jgi:hypothetical protein
MDLDLDDNEGQMCADSGKFKFVCVPSSIY